MTAILSPEQRPAPTPDALAAAAQCWCDPVTRGTVMDARLAEAFASRLQAWMDFSDRLAQTAAYWRQRALAAESGRESS